MPSGYFFFFFLMKAFLTSQNCIQLQSRLRIKMKKPASGENPEFLFVFIEFCSLSHTSCLQTHFQTSKFIFASKGTGRFCLSSPPALLDGTNLKLGFIFLLPLVLCCTFQLWEEDFRARRVEPEPGHNGEQGVSLLRYALRY